MKTPINDLDIFRGADYTRPVRGKELLCKALEGILRLPLIPPLEESEAVVEFFPDGETLTVKIRQCQNEWLEGVSQEDLLKYLSELRRILNDLDLKTVKVQASIHLDKDYKGKTNVRLVYNPHWRRYENYEIFYRCKTQSRRKYT